MAGNECWGGPTEFCQVLFFCLLSVWWHYKSGFFQWMVFLSKQPKQKLLSSVEKTKIYGAQRKSCTGGSVLIASFVLFFCEGSLKCLIWKENGDKSLPETEIILGRQKQRPLWTYFFDGHTCPRGFHVLHSMWKCRPVLLPLMQHPGQSLKQQPLFHSS